MIEHFPRLSTVALSYVAAFLLFSFLGGNFFEGLLTPFGLIGVFISGALYTYSFTASAGAILLIAVSANYPPGVIAVMAGLGGVLADLTIFQLIKGNLKKEVEHLAKSAIICQIGAKSIFCKHWFRELLGTLILASPLPDEIGIALMSTAKIHKDVFILLTFIADVVGVYLLVSVAALIY